jgi:pyruvate ferredoxin oxidoreductase alpha subunit
VFGRRCGELVVPYRVEDADTVVVALGSVLGTVQDTIDELRDQGMRIGALGITAFRPFPVDAVRAQLRHAERVVVLEKAMAVGVGGIVSMDGRAAVTGLPAQLYTVIAGLGGRAITRASLRDLFSDASADKLEPLTFLDLDRGLVDAGSLR